MTEPSCRLCGARLHRTLLDLGEMPLGNRTIAADASNDRPYRLRVLICDECTLVQTPDVAEPAVIAAPRPYLSSRSIAAVTQARRHADAMRRRLRLGPDSLVIEVGSNDGILLRHFQASGVRVLGIEPAPTAAAAAAAIGVPTVVSPFNTATAMDVAVRYGCADLVVAKNVLQHAPDLFDFAAALSSILRPNGVLVLQVPHLLSLVQKTQFDAFRHDSYSYLSLRVLEHVLRSVGLRVFDAERVSDHAGSLRVRACHAVAPHAARPGLKAVRLAEIPSGAEPEDLYAGFAERVGTARNELRDFLNTRRLAGRRVTAYGAATRGCTLLNFCKLTTREITCVIDPDPAKHGRLMPGSRIPIVPFEAVMASPPDDIVILPWPNIVEIGLKLTPLRQKGVQFWIPVPRLVRV
ncbi:MAG TPA: class I SAM-dependent methyltransferase [Rhodopila sp.]